MSKHEHDMLYVSAAAYDRVDDAVADFERLEHLLREVRPSLLREVRLSHDFDASVIVKDENGKVRVVEKHEHPTHHGAAVGLGWGLAAGVVAALFPPVGIALVGTTAGGTALGALLGHAGERMDRADVDELGQTLEAGQADVVAVYDVDLADRVADEMRSARRIVSRTTGIAVADLRGTDRNP
ncbi:Protein of unknown function [Rhodococcus rhodochrous J3]|uniref:DUF1269 domain-containing protein n=2 Tax=Rhodococcus rhodochrous TaxID=1829 RepID=A0AA46WXT5_RHORH|nr:DUF1269 domain-containing protein [Rhodococcus rhodochrous]AYA25333.1 DUF1269 domain-containing protein [Rhodococcus rhodochrous]MBF4478484.1 DUF1269 domain-containing protein [Rhodococcus rhodochrous]MCB8913012.1 DUF1269 domain-containing protein [Rhodococcus rhodochrous]TWH53167.1 uncharacterized protein DUF1269 [Rhodococcus rhodochrous J38]UZF46097.1 DUF1269 domain-containing protein [Rhodococcus rhodochrous]